MFLIISLLVCVFSLVMSKKAKTYKSEDNWFVIFLTSLISVVIFVALAVGLVGCESITHYNERALRARYETLTEYIKNNDIDGHTLDDIIDYNDTIRRGKYNEKQFYTWLLVPRIYDKLEYIDISSVKED